MLAHAESSTKSLRRHHFHGQFNDPSDGRGLLLLNKFNSFVFKQLDDLAGLSVGRSEEDSGYIRCHAKISVQLLKFF